jgi:hypothetical protein
MVLVCLEALQLAVQIGNRLLNAIQTLIIHKRPVRGKSLPDN